MCWKKLDIVSLCIWYSCVSQHYVYRFFLKNISFDHTKCWSEHGARRTLHSLLVGMQNGTAPLEYSLVVSYKAKCTLII